MSQAKLEGAVLRDTCFREDTKWSVGFDATADGAKLCR